MNQRYYSLDVFRGATVALMILVNNPGSWANIYPPLKHAPWHGCTTTDLVFPFFLFAVGNAFAFVLPRFRGKTSAIFLKKILSRAALIFVIGIFLNWSPFIMWMNNELVIKTWTWVDSSGHTAGIRILGVLQRIALAYLFAGLIIYYLKPKLTYLISCVILIMYWLLCFSFGDPLAPYSLSGFWGNNIDLQVLGISHIYKGEGVPFEPEGIVSTITAIVQVIFGYFTGAYILSKGKTYEMLTNLFVAGTVLILSGLCWDTVFPINKKIWTSSYVVYTTGVATLTLAVLIYLVEFRNARGAWSRFFDVFGKNPLFIFVLSGFLPRLLGLIRIHEGDKIFSPFSWFYEFICKPVSQDLRTGSLVYAFSMITFYWLIVYILDKKRIYIKV